MKYTPTYTGLLWGDTNRSIAGHNFPVVVYYHPYNVFIAPGQRDGKTKHLAIRNKGHTRTILDK